MRDGNSVINRILTTFCTDKAREMNALSPLRCTKGARALWAASLPPLDMVDAMCVR